MLARYITGMIFGGGMGYAIAHFAFSGEYVLVVICISLLAGWGNLILWIDAQ